MVISRDNLHEEGGCAPSSPNAFGDRVRLIDTLGAVSVIGAGINASFQNLRRGSDALAGAAASPPTTSRRRRSGLPG